MGRPGKLGGDPGGDGRGLHGAGGAEAAPSWVCLESGWWIGDGERELQHDRFHFLLHFHLHRPLYPFTYCPSCCLVAQHCFPTCSALPPAGLLSVWDCGPHSSQLLVLMGQDD